MLRAEMKRFWKFPFHYAGGVKNFPRLSTLHWIELEEETHLIEISSININHCNSCSVARHNLWCKMLHTQGGVNPEEKQGCCICVSPTGVWRHILNPGVSVTACCHCGSYSSHNSYIWSMARKPGWSKTRCIWALISIMKSPKKYASPYWKLANSI